MSLRPDCNGKPHFSDRAGLVSYTADIVRRPLVTGIQDGGHHCGNRPTSDNVTDHIYESDMVENMGVEVGNATPSLTVEKLFPLPV